MRLSPIVDKFLALRFLEPFLFALGAFSVMFLLGDFFDRFDDLVKYRGFGWIGLEYFVLKLPLIVSQLMPLACLAGVLMAFSMLNRSGEILAFQGLGVSRLEMALPLLALGLLISLFDFGLSETVVPVTTRRARYLFTVELKKKDLGVFANQHIWLRSRDGFLSVDTYNPRQRTLSGLTFFHLGPRFSLTDIRKAASAQWNGHQWQVAGASVLQIAHDGEVADHIDAAFPIHFKPADFSMVLQDPEEFSLAELDRYIRALRSKGLAPGGYLVDRDLKIAAPLACLIMVALGIALTLDPMPRSLSVGRSFALGMGIGFGYWLALGFTSSFGRSLLIPAWTAAWTPNLLFGTMALAIFLFGEER